jgi:hypothetical protein
VREAEGDRRVGQRDALDGVGAVGEFGGFGLEEFPPGRRVVIEVAHFDDGAGHQRGRFRLGAGFAESPGVAGAAFSAGQRQARDRGDRGQRLAAKAERGDAFEVVERGDLRGGVAGQGEREFVPGDAAAVVADADQLDAAFFELDLDRLAAGVERVFEQFLEHRSGSFDDFAGGDLADQQVGNTLRRRPFVAGIGAMSYAKFTFFNLVGAISWVVSLCLAGYWLGNIPWVKQNLSLIIIGIIISSLIPIGIGYLKTREA